MENKRKMMIEAVLEIKLNRPPTNLEIDSCVTKLDGNLYFDNIMLGKFTLVDLGEGIGKVEGFEFNNLEDVNIEELADSDDSASCGFLVNDEQVYEFEVPKAVLWEIVKYKIITEGTYNCFVKNETFLGIDDTVFNFLRSNYINSVSELFKYIDKQIEDNS